MLLEGCLQGNIISLNLSNNKLIWEDAITISDGLDEYFQESKSPRKEAENRRKEGFLYLNLSKNQLSLKFSIKY
jgi:hypothetical protein